MDMPIFVGQRGPKAIFPRLVESQFGDDADARLAGSRELGDPFHALAVMA